MAETQLDHRVEFEPKEHKYTKQGVVYDSVTRIVSSFCHPFDADYWSTYKAVKDLIIATDGEVKWERYKRAIGGWKLVVEHYRKNGHPLSKEINKRKKEYIHAWEVKGRNARDAGTLVHKFREEEVTKRKHVISTHGDQVLLEVTQQQLLASQDFVSNRVYPELIISNDEFQVAGMSDKVEKIGKVVHISDYKTSEKIERIPFGDQMMFPPLQSLADANFYHYTMQLSLYGWMLEQQGYKVATLRIEQLFAPHYRTQEAKHHMLPYRGDLVPAMLAAYRKKNPIKQPPTI